MLSNNNEPINLSAVEQLQRLGWQRLDGNHFQCGHGFIKPERSDLHAVILEQRLQRALSNINPWLSNDQVQDIINTIARPNPMAPMQANQRFWQILVNGFSIETDQGSHQVWLIDFDHPGNNEFLCVNGFSIKGEHQTITPDLVLFVNGLPLAIIETRSAQDAHAMADGIAQLRSFANDTHEQLRGGAPQLFRTNQFMVCTANEIARVGTLGTDSENYLEWKDSYPLSPAPGASSQHTLIEGLFGHADFLDLIRNFTLFETVDGQLLKKIARYQQRRAVDKTMLRLKSGGGKKARGGIIWHSQGSGKSLTMAMLANKIHNDAELGDTKVLFLTDRIQLDTQLTAQLRRSRPESVHHACNVSQLSALLASDGPNLITAMVQKFQHKQQSLPLLNTSKKIIILIDEAHRSHYGTLSRALNTALPNATKIAFTGTPLMRSEKTRKEFGSYIDTYSLAQAVADGVTCPIVYEGRSTRVSVQSTALERELRATLRSISSLDQHRLKQRIGTSQALAEAPARIRLICMDLINHYRSQIQSHGFKAMLVVSSRHAAILYKQMIDTLGGPACAAIISPQSGDPVSYRAFTNPTRQQQQIKEFKQPLAQQPLAILIVKDMLLTGFDAPICQVMYLDQTLREHGLLQAITRVNRCAPGKTQAYIIDYVGLGSYLNEALEMFSAADATKVWSKPESHRGLIKSCLTTKAPETAEQQGLARLAQPLRALIGSHVSAADLTTTIAAVDLWALAGPQGRSGSVLSRPVQIRQIERAIRNYLLIYLDDAPIQRELLSTRLEQIVQQHAGHWERLNLRLQAFHQQHLTLHRPPVALAELSPTEYAFYRLLSTELSHHLHNHKVSAGQCAEMKSFTKSVVEMLKKATGIIDFFDKQDHIRRARHHIKRAVISSSFDAPALRQILMDRYMHLARLLFT